MPLMSMPQWSINWNITKWCSAYGTIHYGAIFDTKAKLEKGDTYYKMEYADITIKLYGLGIVVFDGYATCPLIKDNTHKRRHHNIHYPFVQFTADTEFEGKQ